MTMSNNILTGPGFTPAVDPAIRALRPDFVALSIVVRGGRNLASADAPAHWWPADLTSVLHDAPWADAHLDAWRAAFRGFGAKPQRTPCSAEALRKRAERDGDLPRVNALVDFYNFVSIRYAVPVGGENIARYSGSPRLVRAGGGEGFETTRGGLPILEEVDAGEVVWRDDLGVTCRRWNWRQSTRTRIEVDTVDLWFVLERLDPMPLEALREAGDTIVGAVKRISPDADVRVEVLSD